MMEEQSKTSALNTQINVIIQELQEYILKEINVLAESMHKTQNSDTKLTAQKTNDSVKIGKMRVSKLQDDVASSLSSMGLQPQEEVLLKSGYRIDAVVEVDGKQIAVEVDGPSHFIGRELTGSTILKHRQVATLDGMLVVSIPYWEWDELGNDVEKKQQYLQSLLAL